MVEAEPPTYSQQEETGTQDDSLQVLINPASDAHEFQVGYLGVDGERPSIEGEVQIKGGRTVLWESV